MRALAAVSVLAAALLAAPAARAELPWSPCPGVAGFDCARLDVPLDRSGALPGTVPLAAARVKASSNPRNVAVVALAGGPGQSALSLATDFADVLSPALADRDLLVFDQRGTGLSGSLDCPALGERGTLEQIARRCADEIGPARAFYRTPDSVEDIEALRVAAGYDRLVLFGVSYGTKVALSYAAHHPDRVEALVLDSVVLPEGPDPFRRSSLRAVPRVEAAVCADDACAHATPAPVGDVDRLARRLRSRSITGTVVDGRGHHRRATIGETGLFTIFLAGDLNPTLRAELPGAIRAALHGDRAPILRLSVRSNGLANGAQSATADSDALFLTTTCEESPFPWTREAPPRQRSQEIARAAAALPAGELGPFDGRVALAGGVIPLCVGWPAASPAPVADPPLPQVPTLVLDGVDDVRTPIEDAQAVTGRIPGAQLVQIPWTGHSVLGSDLSDCARRSVESFFADRPAAPCAAEDNPFEPTPRPPRSLSSVRPAGVGGVRGRTLASVRDTIVDARRQVIGELLALGTVPSRVGGLRSGLLTTSGSSLRLRSYVYVPGVTVSGKVTLRGAGTVTVGGRRAAHGRIHISSSGAVRGRLGGRRIVTSVRSAVGDGLPSLRSIERVPRLR